MITLLQFEVIRRDQLADEITRSLESSLPGVAASISIDQPMSILTDWQETRDGRNRYLHLAGSRELEAVDAHVVGTEPVGEPDVGDFDVAKALLVGLDWRRGRILGVFECYVACRDG